MKVIFSKPVGVFFSLLILLVGGCGGSSTDSGSSSPAPSVNPTTSSVNPALDLRFGDSVERYIYENWNTWTLGEKLGQCLIRNAGNMTVAAKQAVIEHGVEDAFDHVVGSDMESLSKTWNLCKAESESATAPSPRTPAASVEPSPSPIINFESTVGNEDFSGDLQEQFRYAVDKHFDAATEKAGISVAVYQDGHLWRYAKGKASSSARMTVGTPTLIRSTSKTFLAGLVLQQIDAGLYSLSDTLGYVLSGNPEYEALDKGVINPGVTIEQLLTMTSGIENVKDYYRPEVTALQESQNWKPVDVVRLVITDFKEPGTYQYSNTNSMLLGLIAEHAGQRQLNELYKSVFFDPLSIVAVLLPQDDLPADTARPHDDRSQWGGTGFGDITEASHHGTDWYRATNKTTWAAAGMITTPENMARWAYELLSDQGLALSPTARGSLLNSFTGPLIPIGGSDPEHLYGYHVTKTNVSLSGRSITAYGHPGSGGGYISDFFYSPELDLAISLLVNSHSDARSRDEAKGKITHRTLDSIAQQIFQTYDDHRQ